TSIRIVVVADDKCHASSLLRQRWGDQHRGRDRQAQPDQQPDIHPAPFLPINPHRSYGSRHLEPISLKTSSRSAMNEVLDPMPLLNNWWRASTTALQRVPAQ